VSSRTAALTLAALCAFAANSLLCRMALGAHHIDPASFTTIRVVAGALTLVIIFALRTQKAPSLRADWRAVAALGAYMVFFSFAYITLSAGTGALILFGCVQLTMFTVAMRSGERFPPFAWAGLIIAVAGLIYLVSPGLRAPDPLGAILMAAAGIAWGAYSLLGRGASDPLAATATNFICLAPFTLFVSAVAIAQFHISPYGAALAIASGAIASGCGYVIWYAALRGLTASRAAVVQLAVPVIAAVGAVALLSEPITTRLLLASAATLGGVAIVLAQRAAKPAR
jgi:drug/metabolite transporter (DMT)-like permease